MATVEGKTCKRCKGWGSIETGRIIPGEPGSRQARICRTCRGSGKVEA